MEQDGKEATGVARSQHVVHTLPHGRAAITQFLGPALDRLDVDTDATQLLVVTADAEAAVEIAESATQLAGERPLVAVPVTGAKRVLRLLRGRTAHVVAGSAPELLALIRNAALKLDSVRVLVLAWGDDILATGAGAELEAIMAEIPKEAARVLVAAQLTPPTEELAERYVRRAPRTAEPAEEPGGGVAIQYVSVAPAARPSTLRRVLDELDPERAAVFAAAPESEREVRRLLDALGYRGDGSAVQPAREGTAVDAPLLVLYDLPASRAELRTLVGAAARTVVALAQPRQLPLLRALAGSGRVTPLILPGPAARARSREEALRAELREALAGGAPSRELLALEPLLEEFDGVELAAAAVRLLEQARAQQPPSAAAAPGGAATGGWTRVFLNIGSRDGARPGDLVGAIAGETGLSSDNIGKIELRDTHALVELAAPHAEAAAEKLTGTTIRGRRIVARVDRDRPAADRERGPRREGGSRGEGGSRSEGGPRGGGGPRREGGRPPRGAGGPRGARTPERRPPRDAG